MLADLNNRNSLFSRVKTFNKAQFYNKEILDPYTLASYGFINTKIEQRSDNQSENQEIQTSFQELAKCSNQNCHATISYDSQSLNELKDELSEAIQDHDESCPFHPANKQPQFIVNHSSMYQLGKEFYEQALHSFQKNNLFLKINILELSKQLKLQRTSEDSIELQYFKKLDERMSLSCINSQVILSVFGWMVKENNHNIIQCEFCGKNANVEQFLCVQQTPCSQQDNSFNLIDCHYPWCCLIGESRMFWKQILKGAAFNSLKEVKGDFNKTELEIKFKQIKDNIIEVYKHCHVRMNASQKRIKDCAEENNLDEEAMDFDMEERKYKRMYWEVLVNLNNVIDDCKDKMETFIKKIKMN